MGDGCFGAGVQLGLAPFSRHRVGVADRLVDRVDGLSGLDPFQPGCGFGTKGLGLRGVVGELL